MLNEVNSRYLPNALVLLADSKENQDYLGTFLPFIQDMKPIKGKATAYVCEDFICKQPTNKSGILGQILDKTPQTGAGTN